MGSVESDREDLMKEAVALPERAELRVSGITELVTIGFRVNQSMSVFIGQDVVYHFDPSGRLRRAFAAGFLYRSQHFTLARLNRVRTPAEVQLLRHDLFPQELLSFKEAMHEALQPVILSLRDRTAVVVRCEPNAASLLPRIESAIQAVLDTDEWLSPEIRRRK